MLKSICKGSLKKVKDNTLGDGYSRNHLKKMFNTNANVRIKGTSDEFDHLVLEHFKGVSISGVQKKSFMRLENGFLTPSKQGEYIVKPTPKGFPYLSENEHVIMKIAEAVSLKVAQCSLVAFEDGEYAYVTKRFDLTSKANIKIFVEDGASICQVAPKNKGSDALSYETCIKQMVKACRGSQLVALTGLKLVLFSYLVGNNDLHLKNFAFYRKPNSRDHFMQSFTPFYDLLCVAPYPEYDFEYLSLSLLETETEGEFSPDYNKYGYYTFEDFLLLAEGVGLKNSAAKQFIIKLINDVAKKAPELIRNSLCPEEHKLIIQKRINERCRSMQIGQ